MNKLWKRCNGTFSAALVATLVAWAITCPSRFAAQSQAAHTSPVSRLLPAAKNGDVSAETALAYAYTKGEGVPQDYIQAAFWCAKAAKQGDAKSQYNLGTTYHSGRGMPKDDVQAAMWFGKAADQGFAHAQLALGWFYERGIGVPKDDAQAVLWLRKASDQGELEAQYDLGWHYQHDWSLGQDRSQSVTWYRKAAEQGFARAQAELAEMYYEGDVVPRDLTLAETWARKAAEQNDSKAQVLLSTLSALKERSRQEQNETIVALGGVALLASFVWVLVQNRARFIPYCKKIIPRASRTKQLVVLLLVASWCTICCLYVLFDPWMSRRPLEAAATVLFSSAPAVIFGSVYFWWVSKEGKGS